MKREIAKRLLEATIEGISKGNVTAIQLAIQFANNNEEEEEEDQNNNNTLCSNCAKHKEECVCEEEIEEEE